MGPALARHSRRALLLLAGLGCATAARDIEPPGPGFAAGFVFADENRNGERDPGETGVRGVAVSNGRDVVRTDRWGRYRLPVGDDTILFVIKPSGWATPLDEDLLPRFYYIHKPHGSPPDLRYRGVAPSGPLPESIDFPLTRQHEPEAFSILIFGDTQPNRLEEVDFLAHDVIEELVGADVAFGITLGDIVGDDLSLFEPVNRAVSHIGVPWYYVHGNHDMNYLAVDDARADETFERVYGPGTHAFAYGGVHFILLDDVIYAGVEEDGSPGPYAGGLTQRQLAFVRNYLADVAHDERVVLAMHIPLAGAVPHEVPQRRELFEILSNHPHTLSLSAHTHFQEHHFFGPKDGYAAPTLHHHLNNATTSGSWWLGVHDELGIPHTTMRCGAPNGYSFIDFDGQRYSIRFQAARRPGDYQMNVYAPEAVSAGEVTQTEVLVNVFAGSEHSVVETRWRGSERWKRLERTAREDPYYAELVARETAATPPPQRRLLPPIPSPHLWVGTLPEGAPMGAAALEVRTTDMFGHTFTAHRLIRID